MLKTIKVNNTQKKMKKRSNKEQLNTEGEHTLLAELERLRQENEDLKKKLEEEHNNMLKVVADYENLKKRLYKDLEYRIKFANSELIKSLLPVIDHLEMALHHTKEQMNLDALIDGVSLTLKQFKSVLETFGLKDIPVGENEIFDPSKHEALMLDSHEDKENNKKLCVNFRYGVLAEFKINDYIYLQSGINHIKQTYNIHRMYDHCAFNEPGEPCPEVIRYVNKTEYYLITIPINIKFIKLSDNNKISPFAFLNINSDFHLLGKYYPDDGSNVDKLKK